MFWFKKSLAQKYNEELYKQRMIAIDNGEYEVILDHPLLMCRFFQEKL